MSDDHSISRSVLAEQVEDRLLQSILSGKYAPDSRIVETRVAKELGISQAPVREALRALEALGLVEILPFHGARVRRPSLTELLEAYAVRAELECLAARLGVPGITAADIAEFEDLMAAMVRAAAEGNRHEAAGRDSAFHARLVRLSGSKTLERTWGTVEPFSRTYITLVRSKEGPVWANEMHQSILRALQARDAAAVEETLRLHFAEASHHLEANWDAEAAS
jgi:DNA-binding GntR family transcriptional regulator